MSIKNFFPFGKKKALKRGTKRPQGSGSRFRDYRGPNGQLEDAQRRTNQSTDSNQ